jgi:hypothetical protein
MKPKKTEIQQITSYVYEMPEEWFIIEWRNKDEC